MCRLPQAEGDVFVLMPNGSLKDVYRMPEFTGIPLEMLKRTMYPSLTRAFGWETPKQQRNGTWALCIHSWKRISLDSGKLQNGKGPEASGSQPCLHVIMIQQAF